MKKGKLYAIIGAAAVVVVAGAVAVYAAWPAIMFNTQPEKYVGYALNNTLKDVTLLDDSIKISELYKKINSSPSTYDFGLTLSNIELSGFSGTEILAGIGADVSLVVDREQERAGLDLKLKKSTTPVLSAKGYVSNNDFGGIVPELYSKYIVADTKDFAYNWNASVLGRNYEIDERIDIDNMYNLIFPKPVVTIEKSIYEKIAEIAKQYTKKLSYDVKGSLIATYNGEPQKLSSIVVTIEKDDAKQLVQQVIDLFMFDTNGIMLEVAEDYLDMDLIYSTLDEIEYYIDSSELSNDIALELFFAKNKIVKIETNLSVIGIEDAVIGVSAGMEIVDKAIAFDAKVNVDESGNRLINADINMVYNQKSPENNIILSMAIDSPNIFDSVLDMECIYVFDEKNETVYTDISKLKMDINYGQEYIKANAKLNFSCHTGIGSRVVIPKDSVNITEAGYAEVFEIYTEVISNLGEIAKLVNIGGIF